MKKSFIIAEIGMNHNGDIELAKKMIKDAKVSGADCVKFQVFKAEEFVTSTAMVYGEEKDTEPARQVDMMKKYEFDEIQWKELKMECEQEGIEFLASVFDEDSLNILENIGVKRYKIASCDVTNLLLLEKIGAVGKPVIMSTGMSKIEEIALAVETLRQNGSKDITLLQCVSSYPAKAEDANLLAMKSMGNIFGTKIGYSDHIKENYVSFAAAALGAEVIEKHFTKDNNLPGVDQKMSLNPLEFKDLVNGIRAIEKSLGESSKKVASSENAAREGGRRGLVAACKILPGEKITKDKIKAKRPGKGINPIYYKLILGKQINKTIEKDEFITWDSF